MEGVRRLADTARLSYTWEFSAAHRLMNHTGKCRRLHGHNYKVTIEVEGGIDLKTGMVVDFDDLKKVVKYVDESFDHKTLLHKDDPLVALLSGDFNDSILILDSHPTVENLCKEVADAIGHGLTLFSPATVFAKLKKITIRETETGAASIEL